MYFLRALHGALPTTCINTDVLLEPHGPPGATRMRRVFPSDSSFRDVYAAARKRFTDNTLSRGRSLQQGPPADEVIQFGNALGGAKAPPYTSTVFEGLEADCLAKVALPHGFEWSVAASGTGVYFVAEAETEQGVPMRTALTQTTGRRASLFNTRPPLSSSSTNSAEHYPDGSTHYMLGEADGTLNRTVPVQKLLQLERLLCFLTGRAR